MDWKQLISREYSDTCTEGVHKSQEYRVEIVPVSKRSPETHKIQRHLFHSGVGVICAYILRLSEKGTRMSYVSMNCNFAQNNFINPRLHAFAAMQFRSSLFWDITRRKLVVGYRRFGKTYRSHLQGSRSPKRLSRHVGNQLPT